MTIVLAQQRIKKFQKEILSWYEKNKRDLPWRHSSLKLRNGKGRDPYTILVSEVMSQQTQLSRVIPKYLAWMERFPTVEELAKAPTSEVLRYWNGLGYNRRALYLQKAAQQLLQISNSKRQETKKKDMSFDATQTITWPQTEKELRQLPGIGEYTARALLCFAFGKQVAVVDTNVRKVILTQFPHVILEGAKRPIVSNLKDSIASLQNDNKIIQYIAEQLLPRGRAYEWNQALMDYAAAELKSHKIPIPKQSHFKTSNRFYRGQVIRFLLNSTETIDSLFEKIENNGISKKQFEEIILKMEKEELIVQQKGKIRLS